MLPEDEIDTSWWHRPLKREDSPCEIGSLSERTIPKPGINNLETIEDF
jgi:hypothetical protein